MAPKSGSRTRPSPYPMRPNASPTPTSTNATGRPLQISRPRATNIRSAALSYSRPVMARRRPDPARPDRRDRPGREPTPEDIDPDVAVSEVRVAERQHHQDEEEVASRLVERRGSAETENAAGHVEHGEQDQQRQREPGEGEREARYRALQDPAPAEQGGGCGRHR